MSTTSKSNFLNNTEAIIENVITNKDHVIIETNKGNAVLLSEDEYDKLVFNVNLYNYRNRVEK